MVTYGLRGLCHGFHKLYFTRPLIPREINVTHAVNLLLSNTPVSSPNGDDFHGVTKVAHGVPFKEGKSHHRIVVHNVTAHRDFFEVLAANDRGVTVPSSPMMSIR